MDRSKTQEKNTRYSVQWDVSVKGMAMVVLHHLISYSAIGSAVNKLVQVKSDPALLSCIK